jgi:hypothetical protein
LLHNWLTGPYHTTIKLCTVSNRKLYTHNKIRVPHYSHNRTAKNSIPGKQGACLGKLILDNVSYEVVSVWCSKVRKGKQLRIGR